MFSLRIEEVALPGAERDKEQLLEWLATSLNLIRRRNEESHTNLMGPPLYRMLQEHFLSNPWKGHESLDLAESLAISPATLHHHLGRLLDTRLVAGHTHKGAGSRIYFLRTGSLIGAIDLMIEEAKELLNLRLNQAKSWMNEVNASNRIDERDDISTRIWIQEQVPPAKKHKCSEQTLWMADLGLLGDRPGKSMDDKSLQIKLWNFMIEQKGPQSLDELETNFKKAKKAKIQRIMENFRRAGFFDKVPRYDRLSYSIWNMLQTQYLRRGKEWLLQKGGLIRQLGEKEAKNLANKIGTKTFQISDVEHSLRNISNEDSMLLLNLLGGRLSFGYQWSGTDYSEITIIVKDRAERTLRRIRRVAELLQNEL